MLRAIVFDFDGVILESADIKTNAFRALFASYPEHVDQIVDFHLRNAGVSRYQKFRAIYEEFLGLPLDPDESSRLGIEFSKLVFDAVLQCPFVNGAQALFDKCAARFHLFIASGTPQGELEKIVSARDLDQYFRSIHGDSTNKADILRRICAERQFPPSDVLFVGDALGDYEGALQAGTLFVGRVQQGSRNPFPQGVHTITGLDDLEKLLPNKEVM